MVSAADGESDRLAVENALQRLDVMRDAQHRLTGDLSLIHI